MKFNFTKIYRGQHSFYSKLKGAKYKAQHETHLHAGEFRLFSLLGLLFLSTALLTGCRKTDGSSMSKEQGAEAVQSMGLAVYKPTYEHVTAASLPLGSDLLREVEFPAQWEPKAFDDQGNIRLLPSDSAYYDKVLYTIAQSYKWHEDGDRRADSALSFAFPDLASKFNLADYGIDGSGYNLDTTLVPVLRFTSQGIRFLLVTNGNKYIPGQDVSEGKGIKKFTLLLSLNDKGAVVDVLTVGYATYDLYQTKYRYFYIDKNAIYTKDFDSGEVSEYLGKSSYGIGNDGHFLKRG